jgi:hypothetical protein
MCFSETGWEGVNWIHVSGYDPVAGNELTGCNEDGEFLD